MAESLSLNLRFILPKQAYSLILIYYSWQQIILQAIQRACVCVCVCVTTGGTDEPESKYLGIWSHYWEADVKKMLTLSITSVTDMRPTWLTAKGHDICVCWLHVHLDHCACVCESVCVTVRIMWTKDVSMCSIYRPCKSS